MARVLLVDDHPDTRAVLAQMLAAHGHCVVEHATGEDALQAISTEAPDALICDARLPGMSGLELLAVIRHDPKLALMHIVICSAADGPREAALGAGANDFWLKGSAALFDAVERFGQRLRPLPAKA